MVWDWLFKRLITPERIENIIKSNQDIITESMKKSIIEVLEDEEIATGVITYTDQIYNRYLGKGGKLWSTIGGVQKGLNATIQNEAQEVNPILSLINPGEELSLATLAKGFLGRALSGNRQQLTPNTPNRRSSRVVPNM